MKRSYLTMAAGLAFLVGVQIAFAGLPLKGVDVKLGRNPGGNCAARVSGEGGSADFGVWPKGRYTISISTAQLAANARGERPTNLHVEISGAVEGRIIHVVPAAAADRLAPIAFTSDGKTPIVVRVSDGTGEPVDAVRVRSHSNSPNN